MKSATLTSMVDQADAAGRHAEAIMHQIAAHEGTQVEHVLVGQATRDVITRMATQAAAGQLTLCPHLSWSAPEPAWWVAWAPGRLRCRDCAIAAQRRIRGTPEDRRCDRCGKIRSGIHADLVQLPALVADLPSGPWCWPPVTAVYGLCHPCQQWAKAA
jgi:hypothetical protein